MFSTVKRCIHTKFGWIWSSDQSTHNKFSFKSVENWNFAGLQKASKQFRDTCFQTTLYGRLVDVLFEKNPKALQFSFYIFFKWKICIEKITNDCIPSLFSNLQTVAIYITTKFAKSSSISLASSIIRTIPYARDKTTLLNRPPSWIDRLLKNKWVK